MFNGLSQFDVFVSWNETQSVHTVNIEHQSEQSPSKYVLGVE